MIIQIKTNILRPDEDLLQKMINKFALKHLLRKLKIQKEIN